MLKTEEAESRTGRLTLIPWAHMGCFDEMHRSISHRVACVRFFVLKLDGTRGQAFLCICDIILVEETTGSLGGETRLSHASLESKYFVQEDL